MNTEKQYEAAFDKKCYGIRLAQKALANANIPNALSYIYYGDGEWGKEELKSELFELVEIWDQGAATLRTISDELEALNQNVVAQFEPFLFIDRLDIAINTANETKLKIEAVAKQVAEMEVDQTDGWASDAQELIEKLAFPISPIRIYDTSEMPSWYGLETLYPFDKFPSEPPGIAQRSWKALTPNPLTGVSGLYFKVTRKLFARYIKPHQEMLESAFHFALLALAIILFPHNLGYSFGAITVSIVAECYWSGYWDEFLETFMFYGAIYGFLVVWFG